MPNYVYLQMDMKKEKFLWLDFPQKHVKVLTFTKLFMGY